MLYHCRRVTAFLAWTLLPAVVLAQNAANPSLQPAAPAALPPPTALPMPALSGLNQSNPFDPARKLWPERVPPVPPPPPPAPVTEEDLSVYGVVMAGGVQKALLKLGKRFSSVPVGSSGLASVSVGAQLGEFVLAQVQADQVLLEAPGGRQWIRFGPKADRQGTPPPLKLAQPGGGNFPGQVPAGGADAVAAVPAAPPGSGASAPPVQAVAASPGATPGAAPAPVAMGGLGAALAAALANQAAQQPPLNVPAAAPGVNPFEALLQQQNKGR